MAIRCERCGVPLWAACECETVPLKPAPAALTADMLAVLKTAQDVGRWVLICNDPPPPNLLEQMCEAEDIADRLLADNHGEG